MFFCTFEAVRGFFCCATQSPLRKGQSPIIHTAVPYGDSQVISFVGMCSLLASWSTNGMRVAPGPLSLPHNLYRDAAIPPILLLLHCCCYCYCCC